MSPEFLKWFNQRICSSFWRWVSLKRFVSNFTLWLCFSHRKISFTTHSYWLKRGNNWATLELVILISIYWRTNDLPQVNTAGVMSSYVLRDVWNKLVHGNYQTWNRKFYLNEETKKWAADRVTKIMIYLFAFWWDHYTTYTSVKLVMAKFI